MSSATPPYVDKVDQQEETIKINDVSENTSPNINPIIEEDMKKILMIPPPRKKYAAILYW